MTDKPRPNYTCLYCGRPFSEHKSVDVSGRLGYATLWICPTSVFEANVVGTPTKDPDVVS